MISTRGGNQGLLLRLVSEARGQLLHDTWDGYVHDTLGLVITQSSHNGEPSYISVIFLPRAPAG